MMQPTRSLRLCWAKVILLLWCLFYMINTLCDIYLKTHIHMQISPKQRSFLKMLICTDSFKTCFTFITSNDFKWFHCKMLLHFNILSLAFFSQIKLMFDVKCVLNVKHTVLFSPSIIRHIGFWSDLFKSHRQSQELTSAFKIFTLSALKKHKPTRIRLKRNDSNISYCYLW